MFFQIAALAVLTVFYAFYLGKMFLQRRKGIQTDQMGKGKKGRTWRIEIALKIVTYLTVVAEVVSVLLNTGMLPDWARYTGLVLGVIGTGFFSVTVVSMKDSWRAGVSSSDETSLVTSGIFRISRNPAFLGFDLVYLGLVLMFFNVWLFAVSMLAIIMLHLQIVCVEEPFLRHTFGENYITYSKHVCRYLGKR